MAYKMQNRTDLGTNIKVLEVCLTPSLITTVIRVANLSHPAAVAQINHLGGRGLIEIDPESLLRDTKKKDAIYFRSTNKGRDAIQKYDALTPLFEGTPNSDRNLKLRIDGPVNVLTLCKEPSWYNKLHLNSTVATSTLKEYLNELLEMGALRILSKDESRKIHGKFLNLDRAIFYVCTEKGREIIEKYNELQALFSPQKEFDYLSELKIRK